MATPAPTPAATPSPAPSPSPSPSPAAAPSPTPSPSPAPTPSGGSAAAPPADTRPAWEKDIDDIGEPKPAPTPPKPGEGTPPPAPGGAKPPEGTPPGPKPDEDEPMPSFQSSKQMREWANGRHKLAGQLAREKKALETKLAELEGKSPKTAEGEAILANKVKSLETQIKEYENRIEHQAFQDSARYRNEYQVPYTEAWAEGEQRVTEMMVNEKTGEQDEQGNPVVNRRVGTPADWKRIYDAPTPEAWDLAVEMFGEARAHLVMDKRADVNKLATKALKALADHRKNIDQYRTEAQQQERFQRVQANQFWKLANEKMSADPKFADAWAEDANDPEANKHLAAGFQVADLFFSEDRDKMKPEDRMVFDAAMRHRIAAFPRMRYKNRVLAARVAELEAKLEKVKGSAPGPGGGGSPEPGTKVEKTMFERIDELPGT